MTTCAHLHTWAVEIAPCSAVWYWRAPQHYFCSAGPENDNSKKDIELIQDAIWGLCRYIYPSLRSTSTRAPSANVFCARPSKRYVYDLLNFIGIRYKDKQKIYSPMQHGDGQGPGTNPLVRACTHRCSSNAEFSVESIKKKTNWTHVTRFYSLTVRLFMISTRRHGTLASPSFDGTMTLNKVKP